MGFITQAFTTPYCQATAIGSITVLAVSLAIAGVLYGLYRLSKAFMALAYKGLASRWDDSVD